MSYSPYTKNLLRGEASSII